MIISKQPKDMKIFLSYLLVMAILFAVGSGLPQFKNKFIIVGTILTIGIMIYGFNKWKKKSKNKPSNKIMAYKEYVRKTEQKGCPKCGSPMKFDSIINTSNLAYRKEHKDALFKCKPCKESYVVLDYQEKKK